MKIGQAVLMLSIISGLGTLPELARSQSIGFQGPPPPAEASVTPEQPDGSYSRPTHRTMVRNYVFDAIGPYTIGAAAFSAGIGQASNSPPEWKQGAEGYGRRFGSAFGTSVVGTSTRYAMSEVFREDTIYYRCECRGVLPRVGHAVISTLTARRGQDGHRVFSLSAFVAPYAGEATAVYGWYPDRYGAKDVFRFGNYDLLISLGGNIAREFLYRGPHSLMSRVHLNSVPGARDPGQSH
jgi:hypothetical protein